MKRFLTFIAPAAIVFLSVLSCKPELDNPGSDNPGSGPDLPEIDPGEYSYVLSDNTIILPAECVDLLQYVDLTKGVFNVPASVADKVSINPGMNIVINTHTEMFPDGLLANIKNVAPDGKGGFDVVYKIAPLMDCFKDIDVSESNMDLTGHLKKVLDGNGNEIEFTATKSITSEKFHVVIPQVDIPVSAESTITPKIEADITMKTQLKAEDYTLSTLNLIVDADCSLGADFSIGLSGEVEPRKKVLSLVFGAIPVGPIIITPTVDFYIIVGIGALTKFEASLTYKRSFRAHVHYDEVEGMAVNTKLMDEEPNALEMNIGPKVEAYVKYGLGIGPGISFFGGAIGVGLSIDQCLSESISSKFNLMDQNWLVSTRKGAAWPLWRYNPTFDLTYELGASANLYGFGSTLSASTPTLKFPLKSSPIAPVVAENLEVRSDGQEVTLRTNIVGGQSILYGPVTALLYNHYDADNEADYIETEFDFDKAKYAQLAERDTVEITAKTTIEPGKSYYVDVFTEIEDANLLMRSFEVSLRGMDKRLSAAIRAILRDIRASAVGEWEGCNWDDNYVMVGDYKNVSIEAYGPSSYQFFITVPEEWEMTDNLKITPHTEGLEDILASWNITIEGDDRYFSKVYIEDPLISFPYIPDNVDSFSFHSEHAIFYETYLPKYVQELDLSRCPRVRKDLTFNMDEFPKLKKLTLNSSPINSLSTNSYTKKSYIMPQIETEGTDLEKISVKYAEFSDCDFSKVSSVKFIGLEDCSGTVNIRGCKVQDLWLGGEFKGSFSVSECPNLDKLIAYYITTPSFAVSDNPKLQSVEIHNGTSQGGHAVGALSICDCPSLSYILCADSGISSLELNNLPTLRNLWCQDNYNLTGVMLPIFDEMRDRNPALSYDKRYQYKNWDVDEQKYTSWIDNGYGFYYEGEPERGYHRK